jgi:hypothetical protein
MSYQTILKEANSYLPVAFRRYVDQKTQVVVTGDTARKIANKVVEVRKSLDLPSEFETVLSEVEEYICKVLPSLCQRRIDGPMIRKEFTRADVLAFIESVKGTILAGGVVPRSVAEARATTCLQCPYNLKLAGCEGCNGISTMVFSLLGASRRLPNASNLKSCGICGCSLKAKVWVPKDVLDKTSHIQETKGQFPSWCWVEKSEAQ